MKQGEVYFVSLDPSSGHEQRSHCPVLILSSETFNQRTGTALATALGTALGAAITNGGNFARRLGFAVPLAGFGATTTGIVRCDQVRVLDLQSRHAQFVERLPRELVYDVLGRTAFLLEREPEAQ